MPKQKSHPAEGHRNRLRLRFLQGGLDAFLDYEIIELLLTLGTPRSDCKQMAKEAIKKFGTLREVLDAPVDDLRQIKGIGPTNVFGLKLFQAISERYAREKISTKITLGSLEKVISFLQEKIGREKKEHFIILCLDAKNNLVRISDVSVGTLDANLIHPREVFKEAIQASAAKVIFAHNHPSGDVEPSEDDIKVTKELKKAGKLLGIEVLDHVIVGRNNFISFKQRRLA